MLAVLDDDPTGVQSQAGVPLLAGWTPDVLAGVARRAPRAVHLLTNSRALEPADAYRMVRDAAEAVRTGLPGSNMLLRGDSTLRAHLLEEYEAVRDAAHGGVDTALLLVPALPPAGRVTVDGVHWLIRDGETVPLHETEYARDPSFGYRSARLLEWAEERSRGRFAPVRGIELPLDQVRADGPPLIADALARAAARAPAAVVPDARDDGDLDIIAAGLRAAWAAETPVIVRCAPAFAGRFAGTTADHLIPMPRSSRGLLVACGSYVPATTRQLERLRARRPGAFIEVQAGALAEDPDRAVDEAVRTAGAALEHERLAIVATSRRVEACGLAGGERIAAGLARIVRELRSMIDVLVSKGGITSAVNLRAGLGADQAEVVGPVAPGISLWRVTTPERYRMSYVVFPGNVGADATLADVVEALAPA